MSAAPLSPAEILGLPASVDTYTVAAALGVSASHVYREVAAGTFPIEPLRIGRSLRFRRSDVVRVLGLVENEEVA